MARKKDKGWIKLHRKIRDNAIWQSREAFDRRSAWVDLLLMVNHEDRTLIQKNGRPIVIHPGQTFTSYEHLKEKWHWGSRNRVKRFLALLSAQGMITVSGTPSGTLITVISWALYQYGGTASGTPTDHQTDHQTDHKQELYKEQYKKNDRRKEPPVPEDRGYQT